jgi:hypothetical protein
MVVTPARVAAMPVKWALATKAPSKWDQQAGVKAKQGLATPVPVKPGGATETPGKWVQAMEMAKK